MANILLGVCSSAAVYKSLDIISALKKQGHCLSPILTANAAKLISPILFSAISGSSVYSGASIEPDKLHSMRHIDLAQDGDLCLIAPATANILAKAAGAIADDLLSTTLLSLKCPLIIAPAMNPTMWNHPAVQENCAKLRERGAEFIGPEWGEVACGDIGTGRLASVDRITAFVEQRLAGPRIPELLNKRILISGGGSFEPIDPVRGIANLSSGKTAAALVDAFLFHGAEVTYLHGRTEVMPMSGASLKKFETAEDLQLIMQQEVPKHDIVIMAAAPGDFKSKNRAADKIKRKETLSIELAANPDILASLPKRPDQLFIGFAAETRDLIANGEAKLAAKGVDLIIANMAAGKAEGIPVGIRAEKSAFTFIKKGEVPLPISVTSKKEFARRAVKEAIRLYTLKKGAEQ